MGIFRKSNTNRAKNVSSKSFLFSKSTNIGRRPMGVRAKPLKNNRKQKRG